MGGSDKCLQSTGNWRGDRSIDNLGPVMVSGLTIKEASDAISEELKNLYSGMDTSRGEQTTFSRVSLERLRSIQVAVIGEAVNPGDYAVPSFSTSSEEHTSELQSRGHLV